MDYIVLHENCPPLECLYYGNKFEKLVIGVEKVSRGDHLQITNCGKYIVKKGWFILTYINGKNHFVLLRDLESTISNRFIKPLIDVELEKMILKNQIDQSLKERNPILFFMSTMSLMKLNGTEIVQTIN